MISAIISTTLLSLSVSMLYSTGHTIEVVNQTHLGKSKFASK